MIHDAINKSKVAELYYKLVSPEKNYTPDQARKQFHQSEGRLNLKVVRQVVRQIYKEQISAIDSAIANRKSKA